MNSHFSLKAHLKRKNGCRIDEKMIKCYHIDQMDEHRRTVRWTKRGKDREDQFI